MNKKYASFPKDPSKMQIEDQISDTKTITETSTANSKNNPDVKSSDTVVTSNKAVASSKVYLGITLKESQELKGVGRVGEIKPAWQD